MDLSEVNNDHLFLNKISLSSFEGHEIKELDIEEIHSSKKLKSNNAIKSAAHYLSKHYRPSRICSLGFIFKRLPFLDWIRTYNLKEFFLKDLIAGLSVGLVHVPQAMGYSLLIGLPAVHGLYVSFFTVLTYAIFGTSRHISAGTDGIICLMIKSAVDSYDGILYSSDYSSNENITLNETEFISMNPLEAKIMITASLAFFVGIFQILLAILHFGFVTKYLSNDIVIGFTVGAAYHIVASQINVLLGVKLGSTIEIPFALTKKFIDIFGVISQTNIATLILSVVTIVLMYLLKFEINDRFKQKLPMPIPTELIMVIVGTAISYLADFNGRWNIDIVNDLPHGLPTPEIPPLYLISKIFQDCITIGIVSFAMNYSMARRFAKIHKYEIGSNQELFAYGIGNLFSSFFEGFPGSVGLSRTVILDDVGRKTQLSGIFASIVILLVLYALGFLLEYLPNAILASVIVVALKKMILEVRTFPEIYKKNKLEGIAWLATFLGVIVFDIAYGLYIGVGSSLLLLIFKAQRARTSILGNIPGTDVFESLEICETAKEIDGVKIIRYEESIYYTNVDNFKYKIFKLAQVNPTEVMAKINNLKKKESLAYKKKEIKSKQSTLYKVFCLFSFLNRKKCYVKKHENETMPTTNVNSIELNNMETLGMEEIIKNISDNVKLKIISELPIKHIIIDCSCINYIDNQGAEAIMNLNESFKEIGITIYLAYCKQVVIKSLKKYSVIKKGGFENIFSTIYEAVCYISTRQKQKKYIYSAP